MDTTRSHNGRP